MLNLLTLAMKYLNANRKKCPNLEIFTAITAALSHNKILFHPIFSDLYCNRKLHTSFASLNGYLLIQIGFFQTTYEYLILELSNGK